MPVALENDNIIRLIRCVIDELRKDMIILPGITTIEKIVKDVRKTADDSVIRIINQALTAVQKQRMDALIELPNETAITTWDKIIASVEEAKTLARPINYDYLDLLDNRYNQLRKYTPALVKSLEFSATNSSLDPLIEALKVINDMNETGKRKVPETAPLGFVSNRWKKHVYEKMI